MTVPRTVLERLAVVETHFSEIKTDLSAVKQDIRSLLAFQAARQLEEFALDLGDWTAARDDCVLQTLGQARR